MSSEAEYKLQQLEINVQNSKKQLELGEALKRLSQNRDFKRLILDDYFREEAIRLVSLRGDPEFQTPEKQAHILAQIDAQSMFQKYLRTISWQAERAKDSILADENTAEEIRRELKGD